MTKMDAANLTSIHTIQMISIVTYLERLSNYLHLSYNLNVNDKSNSFAVINALVTYLDRYGANVINTNFLTHWLLNDNVFYDEANDSKIKYNFKFKETLFDHIINAVVFNDYGNIYGFLAEHVRHSENKIQVLLKNVKSSLERMENEILLNELVIERIVKKIVPLFPESGSFFLNSVDFVYAQAGCCFYHLVDDGLSFNSKDKNLSNDEMFAKCVKIGLAVKQLAMKGIIHKGLMKIFALPALLNYVKNDNFRDLEIKTIVSDPNHWNNAYNLLFDHLHNIDDLIRTTLKERDSKYQYYSALLHFQDRTSLAKREIMKKCLLTNESRLEDEIVQYVKNSNYTCGNTTELASLEQLYTQQIHKILYDYYWYVKEKVEEKTNSQKPTIDRFRINGITFVNCETTSNPNLPCFSLLYACIVGIIEGNRLNSLNCPIKDAIHYEDLMLFDDIDEQLMTSRTRSIILRQGTTLTTLVLISSMRMALLEKNSFPKMTKIRINNATFSPSELKLTEIYSGFEMESNIQVSDLRTVKRLLKMTETNFFYFD